MQIILIFNPLFFLSSTYNFRRATGTGYLHPTHRLGFQAGESKELFSRVTNDPKDLQSGSVKKLESNFAELSPGKTGSLTSINLAVRRRNNNFPFVPRGYFMGERKKEGNRRTFRSIFPCIILFISQIATNEEAGIKLVPSLSSRTRRGLIVARVVVITNWRKNTKLFAFQIRRNLHKCRDNAE